MADRQIFTLPDLVTQSEQTDEYNLSPHGEGKRFWTQVEDGEFNTNRLEICPLFTKKPRKHANNEVLTNLNDHYIINYENKINYCNVNMCCNFYSYYNKSAF